MSAKVFVHIKLENGWDNFKHNFNYIPHTGDIVSFSTDGPIYEVDKTLFNCFNCDYPIEIYIHQISP